MPTSKPKDPAAASPKPTVKKPAAPRKAAAPKATATAKKATAAKPAAAKKPAARAKAPAKSTAAKAAVGKASSSRTSASGSAAPRAERATGWGSGKHLVIVESPAKAKTLTKYLGPDYRVEASVGHVKDLPTKKIGVDVAGGFEPEYVVLEGKEKVLERIRKSAANAESIYLAPDPDREGEAIAWHIFSEIEGVAEGKPIHRATFNEITKKAVQAAIASPRKLNHSLYMAQQARRVLDRLVGYEISPLLWKKVTRGLSAGRVQSVAVRLVVEREREIDAFKPEEYWSVVADAAAAQPPPFEMRLGTLDGKKPDLTDESGCRKVLGRLALADAVMVPLNEAAENAAAAEALGGAPALGDDAAPRAAIASRGPQRHALRSGKKPTPSVWTIARVEKKDVRRRPSPPFITSTLQQEASRKHGFAAKRCMAVAQRLYEGLDLGAAIGGQTALITYMRTDSVRLSDDAVSAARDHIKTHYGADFLPDRPNVYKTKGSAQDAHEAIRPTDLSLDPATVAPFLEPEQLKLYTLIWNRFVACQMADAVFEQTKAEADPADGLTFIATGLVQKFAGYLAVYEEGFDDAPAARGGKGGDAAKEGAEGEAGDATAPAARTKLPPLKVGDPLQVASVRAVQHFTQPPPRFTEASLVKELEKRGIGRPSTYASIVTVIQKEYVTKDAARRFRPTEMGGITNDLLVEAFPEVLDASFTAQMEVRLDSVEEGTADWRTVLGDFYGGFKERLTAANENMKSVKREETPTDIQCEKCGQATMVIKWGRNGKFLACPRYPECKNTRDLSSTGEATEAEAPIESDETCDACGKRMIVKNGRMGRFNACPGYPECKSVKPFKTGVKCPECGTGDLAERMSKRGKMFFSCTNYPKCEHVEWNRPVPKPCPACDSQYVLQKDSAKGRTLVCPKCKHSEAVAEPAEAGAVG